MKSYYILLHDFNTNQPESYDIMPYLMGEYQKCKLKHFWWPMRDPSVEPKTQEDFKAFVEHACFHQFCSRCEYEFLMLSWPYGSTETLEQCHKVINSTTKIDAWEDQIKPNLDIVVAVFMANITKS